MQRHVHQRKYGQNEEEKGSSPNQNPKQCARASFRHEESLAPLAFGQHSGGADFSAVEHLPAFAKGTAAFTPVEERRFFDTVKERRFRAA
jgi:hypothetical protein